MLVEVFFVFGLQRAMIGWKSISVVDKTFSTGNEFKDHVFHDVVNH